MSLSRRGILNDAWAAQAVLALLTALKDWESPIIP
jgi:hypothetical protein